MQDCPSIDELLAFAQGLLPEGSGAGLRAHVTTCPDCIASLAEAARGLAGTGAPLSGDLSAAASEPVLEPGAKLGRYSILELIGKGAMGSVYAAYDPQLDRRVAIKVLRAGPQRAGQDELQQRLLREAQAMARLHHPNVLAIHDAVSFEGGIFLAMDLVPGGTVRAWLEKSPRTPAEVLEVFRQAGEGLAAAHRAGIVHRDFKADNLLIDPSGHVYVTDFGVARLAGELPRGERSDDLAPLALTRSGAMVGTPRYMSPEQLDGQPADARSDIFGFSVALYEALYSSHPFPAKDLPSLRQAISDGRVQAPPAGKGVPAQVERAVLRGLRKDPGERFQTIDELLYALKIKPRPTRLWLPAALGLVLIGGALLASRSVEHRRLAACRAGDGSLARAFDETRQKAVEDQFAKSGSPAAQTVFASTRAGLVSALQAIAAGRADACAATLDRGEASAEMLDRRMQCLDEQTQALSALVDAFAHADKTAVEKAVTAVEQLDNPASCADRKRLLEASPLPRAPAARARISQVGAEVAQLAALHWAARYPEGLSRAPAIAEAARTTGYGPLESEALYWRGRLLFDSTEQAKAPELFVEAAAAATRARRDDLAVKAETQLVHALGWAQKTEDALRWASHARALVARNGDDPRALADLLLARAFTEAKVFNATDSIRDGEEALALLEPHAKDAPASLLAALTSVAGIVGNGGQYQKALELDARALPIAESIYGPLHPLTLNVRGNIGTMYTQLGDYQHALPILQRTLADRRAALGPEHVEVARSLGGLGAVLESLGDSEAAAASFSESNAIVERLLGKDHPELIANLALSSEPLARLGRFKEAYANLDRSEALARKHQGDKSGMLGFIIEARGTVQEIEGRYSEAAQTFAEAAKLIEAAAPGHPDVVSCQDGVARQERRAGHAQQAYETHAALLAAGEKKLGADSRDLAGLLVDTGDDLLALHRERDAQPFFERALKLLDPNQNDPLAIAELRYSAARAIWPQEPKRALELAREAQAAAKSSKLRRGTLREDVSGWLATKEP